MASVIDGPVDVWSHPIWVAAWGRGTTVFASASELRLPMTPEGVFWVARRMLVGGRRVVDLSLCAGPDQVLFRGRAVADPVEVDGLAEELVGRLHDSLNKKIEVD